MPRSPALLLGLVPALLATPARADCNWVRSVASFDATLGWSWYSLKYAWDEPQPGGGSATFEAMTQDAGSATGALAVGYSGVNDVQLGEGTVMGSLRFLDRLGSTSSGSPPGFTQYAADGPILGAFEPLPTVDLYLDLQTCMYYWRFDSYAAGTFTTNSSSDPIEYLGVNIIQSGERPIPDVAGPLDFDGAIHASSSGAPDELTAWFETLGSAAYSAEHNAYAPRTFPDASVHWHFALGGTVAPDNDACTGARFLLGSDSQDVSFATNAATDPTSSCGVGDRSVWFFFVPTSTGTAHISTSGSDYSTLVSVWQVAQTCAALTTEVACGANGASVPVQAGVPLLVQVQRASGGGGGLSIVMPEPGVSAAACVACAGLACLAGRRRGRTRS
jgi:hypothetical protein